jgi:hypothetical protein
VKVIYEGKTKTEHLKSGLVLKPGENDLPDEIAQQMLSAGLVKKAATPAPASDVQPEPRKRPRPDEVQR